MEFSAATLLAAFLAALDAFQPEVASVARLLAGCGPALIEFLAACLRALVLYFGDHVRNLTKLHRVQTLQPIPRYPPRFQHASPPAVLCKYYQDDRRCET